VKPTPNNPTSVSNQKDAIPWIDGFIEERNNITEPITAIYYPVLSEADTAVSIANVDDRSNKLVAVLTL
jgi:hypothetical protein